MKEKNMKKFQQKFIRIKPQNMYIAIAACYFVGIAAYLLGAPWQSIGWIQCHVLIVWLGALCYLA